MEKRMQGRSEVEKWVHDASVSIEFSERVNYFAIAGNLVTYLTKVIHQDLSTAAKSVNYWLHLQFVNMKQEMEKRKGGRIEESDEEKWVHDASVDYKGRIPLRASTGVWKASLFVLAPFLVVSSRD
ncbi:hypothetical protein JHK82_049247 [Glycine max]|nr:hypothetical protein JHK82_049247 [Glycine max]